MVLLRHLRVLRFARAIQSTMKQDTLFHVLRLNFVEQLAITLNFNQIHSWNRGAGSDERIL